MAALIFLYISTVLTIFAILNPIGAVPTLMVLTENYTKKEKSRVIFKSIMVATGMILGFMLLGVYIFSVLGISISDFKVAGGALLFIVAFDMLQGKTSRTKLTQQETDESLEKEAIGVVPIGTPLLAGPGTITTAIIYFNTSGYGPIEKFVVLVAIITVLIFSYIILRLSTPLFDRMGKTGSLIISRIMGLLLASIGVEFMVTGLIAIVTGI